MRLIDWDKVLEWMHRQKETTEQRSMRIAIENYVDDMPTVDAEPIVRWIPCSERLPKDGVYLVYAPNYQGGSSSSKEWNDGVMFSKCRKGKWSVEHGYYSRPNCVKAWMPLPKPYEVKEDETN